MADGTVENEMCPVLVATCPDPQQLAPDPAEVSAAAWVDWEGFRADVLAGRRLVSPWCTEQVAALPPLPLVGAVRAGRLPPAAAL
jgi:isopentenyl-diphosphate delta-isomerase